MTTEQKLDAIIKQAIKVIHNLSLAVAYITAGVAGMLIAVQTYGPY